MGIRNVPLVYVIRDEIVNGTSNYFEADQLYYTETGSIEAELVQKASHSHPLFREDSAKLYFDLEEDICGTVYAGSIQPFQRKRDGR